MLFGEEKMNWNYARYGAQNIENFGEYDLLTYEDQDGAQTLTNRGLSDRSNALAASLAELGIKRGDIVAVVLPNSLTAPVAFNGIFRLGAVFLPVIFGLTASEIRYILEDSGAVAVVTNAELHAKIAAASDGLAGIRHIIVEGDAPLRPGTISFASLIDRQAADFEMAAMAQDDLAVLMYTSGTTGSPKGVMLSHYNISITLENGLSSWPSTRTDVSLVPLPLNHIFGMLMVNECNVTGARMIIHKWFDPKLVLESIARNRVTQFAGVPTMLIKLLEAYDPAVHDVSSLAIWKCGGAQLSAETVKAVEKTLGGVIYDGLGMTETAPSITRQRVGQARKAGSVGPAIDGVTVKIFDEQDHEVPAGQDGEICVQGPGVMLGYLNKPAETAEAKRNGWLHTGDMGHLDEAGNVFITGRKKDLIIRGGENISPGSVEDALFSHPAVLEAAVIGVPDPLYGEEVKACIVLRDGCSATAEELIGHCLKTLPRFKSPKTVSFMRELPKNPVGKILKKELRKMG